MRLRPANDREKRDRDLASFEAWGAPLTLDAWADREERLRGHRWAQEVMTTWLLCDDGGKILSSCETFRVAANEGRSATAYGIASVYTEPALRKQGHATRMLTLLAEELRRRDPLVQAAFLFSDVGAEIYRRSGYLERPAFDWTLPAAKSPADAEVRWINEGEVGESLARFARPQDPFSVWPSEAQLDWHRERERIYAAALKRPRPRHAGAQLGKSTALWSAVIRSNELVVLLLDARSQREAERLLRAAAATAHQAGLETVRLWETPGLPDLRLVAKRTARSGSLPMIAPLKESVSAEGWRTIPRALWL